MDLALYAPGLGYYERSQRTVGRRGDFYTSVSVGSVFGDLLAFQLAHWLEELPRESRLELVESGAHNGQLAVDLLNWFHLHRPYLAARLQLWLVEPSTIRQAWQAESLHRFVSQVNWATCLADLATQTGGIHGVFYSNELLDAFPVHRVSWNPRAQTWEEVGVAWQAGAFAWAPLAIPAPAAQEGLARLNQLPAELRMVLPAGFTTELTPAAEDWWSGAAQCLRAGRLVTLDYGLTDEEFLLPQRSLGTLRTYAQHRPAAHPLENPGEQDLTAHINLSSLQKKGEAAGLITEFNTTQRQWLTGILSQTLAVPDLFPPWHSSRVRQFQTLTHPEHLGRSFRVLVQRR